MTDSATSQREANRVLILLMLSVGINYIDRGALSISAPLLARELALSPAQLGLLFSGFFWTYSVLQPLAGWLVDRYNVTRVFGAGYLLWSLATGSVAWIHQFSALFGSRLVLGAGESVAYPAYSRILVQHFPESRRGFANSLLEAAAKTGPAISVLIGGLLVAHFGWRALFVCLGVVSLLWLVPWTLWGPSGGALSKEAEGGRISVAQIMRRREAWGTSLGMFALGYVWSFLLSWLPTYMVNERGFSMRMVALLGSLPFWAMAVTAVIGGWLSDRWIASGGSVTRVRKTFMNGGLLTCGATLLPAAAVRDSTTAMVLLMISSAALGFFTSNVWAVTQTLAGPRAAGSWTGIQNAIGNLGGVLSPYLTGVIVGVTGSYYLAFAACSAVILAGVACNAILVGEIGQLDWTNENR
jgi:MFS family permease